MKWISVSEQLPDKSGKYVVSTVGTQKEYVTRNKFLASYHYNETTKKGVFDVSNQQVVAWLDEK